MTKETTGNAVKDYAYNIGDLRTSFTLKVDGVQQLSNTYSYDALGRMAAVSGSGVSAQYGYDENGNRSVVAYGNGVLETYAYNKANLVSQVANKKGTAILSQYDYAYDLSGNQVAKTDHTGKVTAYTHDGLGQLTGETERIGSTQVQAYSYRYDGFHNRTRLTATGAKSFTTDYIYDKNNRLKQETKLEGGTTHLAEHQYDPNGNLYSTVNSLLTTGTGSPSITLSETLDGLTLYEYDGFNRQVGVKTAGTTASYRYLPNGLRESKTVNGTTTSFVWDGTQTVLTTMGGVNTKYLRGMNLIASLGSEISYYLYNAHGDVVQLTNSSGTVTKEYDYDAFAADPNPFRYCGEYLDVETDTYYLRARYYNPTTGRFLTEDTHWNPGNMIYGDNPVRINERQDPLGLNIYTYVPDMAAIMQSSNLYVYGGNNSLMFVDPMGEAWWHWAIAAGLVAAAAIATVATAGGAAPALIAVASVANGIAAGTVASTVAAGAFIGSSAAFGTMAFSAALQSNSIKDFNAQGNWGTVLVTSGGVLLGGAYGASISQPTACFIAGTEISVDGGHKPIEDVSVGDTVYSQNTETGEMGLKNVTQVFIRETDSLIYLRVDGQEITTTPEHPFYVPQKGWMAAKQLTEGNKLLLQSGELVVLDKIRHETLKKPVKVYNFEVEDWHTYYVSNSNVLVHNTCSNDFIKHSAYNNMRNKVGEKGANQFINAMKKGLVGSTGQEGIKMLSGDGVKIGGTMYQYEVKLFGELANYRLYGNFDKGLGQIVFTYFGKAQH